MAIADIKTMTMEVERAKEEHSKYVDLAKRSTEQHVHDMKAALWQMSQGKELIDIYQTFRTIPLQDDMPRLAIVRADAEVCYFIKRDRGAGCFGHKSMTGWNGDRWRVGKVALPTGTFNWENPWASRRKNTVGGYRTTRQATTVPPSIPASVYPRYKLHNYFLLWEVERGGWTPDPMPPSDPYLMKRITKNLFVPLAAWDLTPLERSILAGVNGPDE